jgi:hypothetical protein
MEDVATGPGRVGGVAILERDPDLAEGLSEQEFEEARRVLVAPAVTLPRGDWSPRRERLAGHAHLGVLVLDGLLTREVDAAGTLSAELVGPGDLLRPWDQFGASAPIPFDVRWRVLEEARVALLNDAFAATAARWPPLTSALVGRAVERAQRLALSQAIGCTTGLELRLLILFWHLADRWGKVGAHGIFVPVALTHETIGRVIGARRPSVSTALKLLEMGGQLRRVGRTGWLLRAKPPHELERRPRSTTRRLRQALAAAA